MELFLNLLWLLLAVPALWIWRREPRSSSESTHSSSLCRLLVLSCTLMLLFPVVSATDDLHAMRPEMEESTSSKRIVKVAVGAKLPAKQPSGGGSFLALAHPATLYFNSQYFGDVIAQWVPSPTELYRLAGASRAPPASFLA